MRRKKSSSVFELTVAAFAAMTTIGLGHAQAGSQPNAVIDAIDLEGMAPFAVHVNALDSTLGAGTPLTTRYAWNFGDASGEHNQLDAWNTAHIYDDPGVYTIQLTVTNELGISATAQATVTVNPDTRTRLYVAANGNDSNSGLSPTTPLRTYAQAISMLTDNMAVMFRRGDTFDVASIHTIDAENVLVGVYGTGPMPRLRWTGGLGTAGIVGMDQNCRDVVVEDIHFDSAFEPDTAVDIANAVYPAGINVTVRNCFIDNLSYCFNCNRNPVGFLALNNDAAMLGAYFSWVQGTDHTYLGNTAEGSLNQHIIRLGYGERICIARNEFHTDSGRCVWAMRGSYCYVTENLLDQGGISVGPNPFLSDPTDRYQWMVIERNEIPRDGGSFDNVLILAGAEHVMVRNNVIAANGSVGIYINKYDDEYSRTAIDVHLLNNTGMNNTQSGQFVIVGKDVDGLQLVNNLYSAPDLITGQYQSAVIYVEQSNLDDFDAISRNVWSMPAAYAWIDGAFHYVWPYWSDPAGYKTPQQWNDYAVVDNDAHVDTAFGFGFAPMSSSVAATHGRPVAGVFNDFNGNARSMTGVWSAGAVETNTGEQPTVSADLTGDGCVDQADLGMLLAGFGRSDMGDTNGDGVTNQTDLGIVLGDFGNGCLDRN